MIRKHIIFYGRVQGVGFRYHATYESRSLGLTGWVRNLSDGTVEMEVQGDPAKIDRMLAYLDGQKYIRIEGMDTKELPLKRESGFDERW